MGCEEPALAADELDGQQLLTFVCRIRALSSGRRRNRQTRESCLPAAESRPGRGGGRLHCSWSTLPICYSSGSLSADSPA
jgi:hypothetical protein